LQGGVAQSICTLVFVQQVLSVEKLQQSFQWGTDLLAPGFEFLVTSCWISSLRVGFLQGNKGPELIADVRWNYRSTRSQHLQANTCKLLCYDAVIGLKP